MADKSDPIRLAHPEIGVEVLTEIQSILASGRLTGGPYRERFEGELCRRCGVTHAVLFNSGTSALLALLRALEVGEGDRVVVPDYGFVATANAVELLRAKPVFVDVDAENFNVSPETLARLEPPMVKAAVVVHQFGLPADLARISDWAEKSGVLLGEDSACALGSFAGDRALGCATLAGALSFHPRKVVTTGEGGAVLTDDDALAAAARAFADHGFTEEGALAGPGMNLRLPEVACALGLAQLGRLEEIVQRRQWVGDVYRECLAENRFIHCPQVSSKDSWNHQTFAVVLDQGVSRNEVVSHLRAEGIESNVPAVSISELDYYRRCYQVPEDRVPVSRSLTRRALGLPCHEHLSREQIERICTVLLRALRIS